jgi:hypothetical protein
VGLADPSSPAPAAQAIPPCPPTTCSPTTHYPPATLHTPHTCHHSKPIVQLPPRSTSLNSSTTITCTPSLPTLRGPSHPLAAVAAALPTRPPPTRTTRTTARTSPQAPVHCKHMPQDRASRRASPRGTPGSTPCPHHQASHPPGPEASLEAGRLRLQTGTHRAAVLTAGGRARDRRRLQAGAGALAPRRAWTPCSRGCRILRWPPPRAGREIKARTMGMVEGVVASAESTTATI